MSKKMKKIPSIFKNNSQKQQQWQWPSSCRHPRTLSFRSSNNRKTATPKNDDVFKTINSVFLDTPETPESWFTNSSDCASTFSDERSDGPSAAADAVEMIIRGVRSSERLFFEPGGATSSILKDAAAAEAAEEEEEPAAPPFEGDSVAVAMESDDPYTDFKKSMREMVDSHGLKDWDCLEELLGWYLKMNGSKNHGFILAAFVDLLVGLGDDGCRNSGDECDSSVSSTAAVCSSEESTATATTSYSSADSCFSSPVAADDNGQSDIVVPS